MAFDQYSALPNPMSPATTYTANFLSAWFDTGDGGPIDGMNLEVVISQVFGNPQVGLRVVTSDANDGTGISPVGIDEGGPINTPGIRNIKFRNFKRYYAVQGIFGELPSWVGSLNSSSMSSQSFGSSYSGAPLGALTLAFGITMSQNG